MKKRLIKGEYRFFDLKEGIPYFSTQEFHNDRDAAPHIDQHGMQRDRLLVAAEFVKKAVLDYSISTVTDVCCGDGGLLHHLKPFFEEHKVDAWGYDFQPENVKDAQFKRGVNVVFADAVNEDIELGELTICTEALEHMYEPHEFLQKIAQQSKAVVVSSPNGETPEAHYEFHLWGWSEPAYRKLVEQAGYTVVAHENSSIFQIIMGVKRESSQLKR